jgi:hypothetical protein
MMSARHTERSTMSGQIEIPTLDDVRSAFGVTAEPAPTKDPDPEPEDKTEDEDLPEDDAADEAEDEQEGDEPGEKDDKTGIKPADILKAKTKDSAAFAELRIQNKKQQSVIVGVADILGLDSKTATQDEIINAVHGLITQAQAKATGLDPNTLIELDSLREINSNLKAQTRFAAAQQQILGVSKKYGASEEELVDMINQIKSENPQFDPETTDVNYEHEYLVRFQDKIVDRKVAAAVAAEQARLEANKKAPGLPPGKGQTSDAGKSKEISTVAELDTLFKNIQL